MPPSLVWYDLETWGIDPACSGIASFACQRTDDQLNPIEEPHRLFCKPPADCLPEPEALLVHGISPQQAHEQGLDEYDFAKAIHQLCNQPDSCIIGFNNIRFDDEFCRYLFYRNLLDPYSHQWRNNNSRWDVIDSFRTCHAFKPASLHWLLNEQGQVSFTLESLANANDIAIRQSHDALSDVHTTIALSRLLRNREPQLYQHMFSMRTKTRVDEQIHASRNRVFAHVSGMLPARHGRSSLIALLSCDNNITTRWYGVDLHTDCSTLLSLSVDEIKEILFTPREQLPRDRDTCILKTVHTNHCPVLLPPKMLTDEVANRLHIDLALCQQNYQTVANNRNDLAHKVRQVYDRSQLEAIVTDDVNRQLYDGFFSNQDTAAMTAVHQVPVDQWDETLLRSADDRVSKLWVRLLGRHQPALLSQSNKEQWDLYLQNLYNGRIKQRPGITSLLSRIEDIVSNQSLNDSNKTLMYDLEQYLRQKASTLNMELPL